MHYVDTWHDGTGVVLAAIVKFLGSDSVQPVDSVARRMRAFRRAVGLSIEQSGRRAGIDEESGRRERAGRFTQAPEQAGPSSR